jgi:hypothetical protein
MGARNRDGLLLRFFHQLEADPVITKGQPCIDKKALKGGRLHLQPD